MNRKTEEGKQDNVAGFQEKTFPLNNSNLLLKRRQNDFPHENIMENTWEKITPKSYWKVQERRNLSREKTLILENIASKHRRSSEWNFLRKFQFLQEVSKVDGDEKRTELQCFLCWSSVQIVDKKWEEKNWKLNKLT